ncbi:facilitated trehalose transporter Tret1-like [Anabrus simplex]|uniref:facilitated trehalose transporter Tret1-like n=1 Tax=Anabrus simplex TaxID=316456 RepID=UPI0035A2BC12
MFLSGELTSDSYRQIYWQFLLAIAASLGYLFIGMVRGFSSPAVPSMQSLTPHLVQEEEAISWIVALPALAALFGSLFASPFLQRIGRRKTLMISSPLAVAGWLLIAFAYNSEMLLVGRSLTGFSGGIMIPSAQVYVNECSRPQIRGVLGSLPAVFLSAGIVISYVMGTWVTWQVLAGASAVIPAALFFLLVPLPESPAWLMDRGRVEEADKAIKWLRLQPRNPTDQIPNEQRRTSVFTVLPDQGGHKEGEKSFIEACLRRPVMLPFCMSLFLLAFQQLSGIGAIVAYAVDIFISAGISINENFCAIIVGMVRFVSNIAALFVVDRAGRKPLLQASGLLMALTLAALGAYFYLLQKDQADQLKFLPLLSLILLMVGYSIGYCTLPYLMMGELLPVRQRSFLGSAVGCFNMIALFLVVKSYPNLNAALGKDGTFWFYSAMCSLSCVFVAVMLPETKGKSLEEIEEYFERKYK